MVQSTLHAHDEKYVVDSKGHAMGCTGEALFVSGAESEKYFRKNRQKLI